MQVAFLSSVPVAALPSRLALRSTVRDAVLRRFTGFADPVAARCARRARSAEDPFVGDLIDPARAGDRELAQHLARSLSLTRARHLSVVLNQVQRARSFAHRAGLGVEPWVRARWTLGDERRLRTRTAGVGTVGAATSAYEADPGEGAQPGETTTQIWARRTPTFHVVSACGEKCRRAGTRRRRPVGMTTFRGRIARDEPARGIFNGTTGAGESTGISVRIADETTRTRP